MTAIKKKKHVSKKNKKDWRKHCDIRDVEEFLEDQRLEERLGKFSTKPDSELFVIDVGEDVKIKEEKLTTAKAKKRANLPETPKCYEVLLPASKVQDPNAKRNVVNPVGSQPTALSKLTDRRCRAKGLYLKKVEELKKNRRAAFIKKKNRRNTKTTFESDIWGKDVPKSKEVPETLQVEFLTSDAKLHNIPLEKRTRKHPPPPEKVITRAAVEPPHPGVSYNPTFEEHQQLLQEVVEHEKKQMKREAHLNRVTSRMFSRVTPAQKENRWLEEMSQGLPKPHDPADGDSSETDNEYRAVNPPVKNKKKDHKARRKQKERLVEAERLRQLKIEKKKITDLYKLRKLQCAIVSEAKSKEQERVKRASKRASAAVSALPALNANRMPQKEPDLVEPSQLPGDLRHLAPTSNLLRERFEALQRRGAVAPSKIMMKKKRKIKGYFRPGHKVTEQDINKYIAKTSNKLS